jgi:LuxR family transcriptional regulator, maltose regulon positive regulatory protein
MALTLSIHETIDYAGTNSLPEVFSSLPFVSPPTDERIHLFADKLRVPTVKNHLPRPRLIELLEKSGEQFGATLLTGRAETGKTVLAADFAEKYKKTFWYRIEAAETDWHLFSRYFAEMFGEDYEQFSDAGEEIIVFVEQLLAKVSAKTEKPILIVLDDVHNVFDAEWFAEFFVALLYMLSPNIHLLLLSRTKPPQPLWRLRSKQVLGVIDEKLLAFNLDETKEFFIQQGIPVSFVLKAHSESFGRISRLKQFAETVKF